MVDDSQSMGQAGPVALEALAIISSALNKLEVGDISVVSFAEQSKVLHSFGQPFTDESGARVTSELTFCASQTRLSHCLKQVLPVFQDAAESSGGSVGGSSDSLKMQLCFVISDARIDTDNRESLTALVRQFAEQHVLVVLLIIDRNEDSKNSIFSTKTVEFTDKGIVTKAYLDNFPFPYYAAIQRLEGLPEVLADALKQWFQMVQNELN